MPAPSESGNDIMSKRPLVSVVIPVYNGANYLAEAIDSALAQTWPNTEVIVIDDGSDDDGATAAVAGRYAAHIRYIRQPNGGVAAALNRGIATMRGAYFSWLSHDDVYVADKVERQMEARLAFGQRCIVIGDFEHFGADGYSWHGTTQGHNLVGKPLDAVFRGLINGCALLVPRSLFDEVGTFNTGLPTSQDYLLWYRMARKVPFVQSFHVGVRQRVHAEQGSRQSGHLDESGRMFINLLEQTPPEIMRGYAGSEVEFLLDLRSHMSVYPAALAWLHRRLRELRAGGLDHATSARGKRRAEVLASPQAGARGPGEHKSRITAALDGGRAVAWRDIRNEAKAAAALTEGFSPGRPVVLLLMHTIGGGSQTHVFHFADALCRRANVLFAYGSPGMFRLSRAAQTPAGGLEFDWPGEGDRLVRLLRKTGLARIDIHSTYRFHDQAHALLTATGVPHDLTVLDYDLFARHPHLAGADGRFVGDGKLRNGSGDLWLPEPHAIVQNASRIITLCRDTAARLKTVAEYLPIISPEHWERPATTVRHVMPPKVRDGEPLRIIVPGRIDSRKGSELVVAAAELASRRRLPLRFEILGSLVVDAPALARAGESLAVLGSYDRGSFAAALSAAAPHVAWIPTQVPETWCYVLSELFGVAMPIAATSIGALRERCHGREATWLLPYDASAETWVDLFLRLRASELTLAPMWPAIDDLPPSQPFYFKEYLQPMQQP
jgi:hypothetical protein